MAGIKAYLKGSAFIQQLGIRLRWMDDDSVTGEFTLPAFTEGPPGHIHGGVLASVLDEAMGAAAHMSGHRVVAVHLEFDYKLAVAIGAPVKLSAHVSSKHGRKIYTRAELRFADETIAVTGNGLFVEAPQFFTNEAFHVEDHP